LDIFDLDRALMDDYAHFARSFSLIRAPDIQASVDALYASKRFWPDPLISINPRYKPGATLEELVSSGALHPDTAGVFRVGGQPIRPHTHQSQAVVKGVAGQSFVVTSGTGSGKSLCFFIPIVDAAIRARATGQPRATCAIIVYPMNALANSQLQEINDFLAQSDLPPSLRPTVARYTGQESPNERAAVRQNKPDILLTNFMMLELLMTRQKEDDLAVMDNAKGLKFLVLDELHTYRGRQGADVAMLMRRVRDRLCQDRAPVCIGTSATMASEGSAEEQDAAVAAAATKLFAAPVSIASVIRETLDRATLHTVDTNRASLAAVIDRPLPSVATDAELATHPLAAWLEMSVGLKDAQGLQRRRPVTLRAAAERLAGDADRPVDKCEDVLRGMLVLAGKPERERGGQGERAFMTFKLHRFLSGAGHAHATLREPSARLVTVEGQKFHPEDPDTRLYPVFFCRVCGQEYHPVTLADEDGRRQALPRPIDEPPLVDADAGRIGGYLMPEPTVGEFDFDGSPECYPEEWQETSPSGQARLKKTHRARALEQIQVSPDGALGSGRPMWFSPGKFGFCPVCLDQPAAQAREINKLAALSAEGRSSATTLLVSSTLRWMGRTRTLAPHSRKLLGFTDNRQDAALQSGHFNDFLFVSLLRAAILTAVERAGNAGLPADEFGRQVQAALGFTTDRAERRGEWMQTPDVKGVGRTDAANTLVRVLTHRVWVDQRRGWRYTNPNLEELYLVRAHYPDLSELARDEDEFANAPAVLRSASPAVREKALTELLETLRKWLAIETPALDRREVENLADRSQSHLREPWVISRQETLRTAASLMVSGPKKAEAGARGEGEIIRAGPTSGLARRLRSSEIWGAKLETKVYTEVLDSLLKAAAAYGFVREGVTEYDLPGWRLIPTSFRLVKDSPSRAPKKPNTYFTRLYETLARALEAGGEGLFGLESREHTAQVDDYKRRWREWRFRYGAAEKAEIAEHSAEMLKEFENDTFLPVLFCSPTMELGVDISALNAVYLRNVPPTPANYAQRSGRAGRSGQAALVLSYCAAQSPHDQYFFKHREDMVSGIVRPPALDLANRELILSHLHAVWLAEAGAALESAIPQVLDLQAESLPLRQDLRAQLEDADLRPRARRAARRILATAAADLGPDWDLDELAEDMVRAAPQQLSVSFQRWRDLYTGARQQMNEANRRQNIAGLKAEERRAAKLDWNQAADQVRMLEAGGESGGSDFNTYRYLATEGFLPGYNFPRLPLYAFIPAQVGGGRAAYLQRARFLAIAEFGPRSLIYHEGRAYRVHKARLPPAVREEGAGKLATRTLWICGSCGASHPPPEPQRCHACGALVTDQMAVKETLRIENVETVPTERITANDEDRQRQGFDIQTVFAWPRREGVVDVRQAVASDDLGDILHLDYAAGTTISRLNKGLRRRADKSLFGFGINPATGRWGKAPDEEEGDAPPDPDKTPPVRVVPIVQDTKNAALLRPVLQDLPPKTMATLQHALSRGLDLVFQLEQGETLAEPVPEREARRGILAFEATEGGAGVLTRLVNDPEALARVAHTAVELMHYGNVQAAIDAGDPALLEPDEEAECVVGCYRCLLSYYNQPDHELIDRTDALALRLLLRLARSTVGPRRAPRDTEANPWTEAAKRWGLPRPDAPPAAFGDLTPLSWSAFCVAAGPSHHLPGLQTAADSLGFILIGIDDPAAADPPAALLEALAS
jgi:superfamily II DNA/RNA helicase